MCNFSFFFGYYDNVILCYGRFVFIDLSATDLDIPKNQFIQTDIFPKEKVFDRWFSRWCHLYDNIFLTMFRQAMLQLNTQLSVLLLYHLDIPENVFLRVQLLVPWCTYNIYVDFNFLWHSSVSSKHHRRYPIVQYNLLFTVQSLSWSWTKWHSWSD